MQLRHARLSDAAAGARVHHETWVSSLAGVLPASFWETHTLADRTRKWRHHLLLGWKPLLAEVDGEIVGLGYAKASWEQYGVAPVRDRQLCMLYVLEQHHGTGVGQALLDAVVPPGDPCQLWVAEGNPRARRFYERNGFTMEGARITDEDFAGVTELRMVR